MSSKLDLAYSRLQNQRISHPLDAGPVEMVRRLGAVQAQDYPAARWALGLRIEGATEEDIEAALARGEILRTHVMRPTWHYVTPEDIRWMLALTAPRIKTAMSYRDRVLELDEAIFAHTNAVLEKALSGGNHLTRPELVAVFEQAGIKEARLRYGHILMRAEIEGIVCSGARKGSEVTYALLEERVPPAPPVARGDALARLARRYFTSHGPATLQDYIWWSGLLTADARAGLESVKPELMSETAGGQTYWFAEAAAPGAHRNGMAYLLPNFDEYIVAYKDRSAVYDEQHTGKLDARGNVLFNHTIIQDGRIAGTWRRVKQKSGSLIEAAIFAPLAEIDQTALKSAAERYGRFLGVPVTLSMKSAG